MSSSPEIFSSIIEILSQHKEGMKMKDLAEAVHMNRNAIAKYLGILHQQGQVDLRQIGKAKIFTVSRRYPYSVLSELNLDSVIGFDKNLRCIQANTAFLELINCTLEEILNKPINGIMFPLFQHPLIVDIAKDGLFLIGQPISIPCKIKENMQTFEVRSIPVVFNTGVTGCAITIKNITLLTSARNEIDRLKELYKAVTVTQTEFIVHSLPDGTITYVNHAFATLIGLSPEIIIRKKYHLKILDDDIPLVRDHFLSIKPESPNKKIENRIITISGDIRWIRWVNQGFFSGRTLNELHSYGIDITEQKILEERLQFECDHFRNTIQKTTTEFQKINQDLIEEIEKRKLVEEDLQKLQITLNYSSELVVWTDEKGIIISSNRAAMDLLGVIHGNKLNIFYSENQEKFKVVLWDNIWKEVKSYGCYLFECLILDKNNNLFSAEVLVNYLCNNSFGCCCFFIRNINKRKMAEIALKESEERFKAIIQNSFDIIGIIDAKGDIIYASPSTRLIFGYLPEEICGHSSFEYIHPDDQKRVREAFKKVVKKRKLVSPTEFRLIHKNGSLIDVETIGVNLIGVAGVEGIVVTTRPIIERKKSEILLRRFNEELEKNVKKRTEELCESRRMFKDLVENIDELILSLDLQGIITYISPAVTRLCGYTPESLVGQKFYELIHPDDNVRYQDLLRKTRQEKDYSQEFRFICKERVAYVRLSIHAITQAKKITGFNCIVTDISSLKKALDETEEARRSLDHTLKFLQTVISAIPIPFFYKDREGRYLKVNDAFVDILGHTPDFYIGKTVSEIWDEEYGEVFQKKDLELIQTGVKQIYESNVPDVNHIIHPAIFYKNIFHDENGEIAGIVGAFLDITKRKKVEKILQTIIKSIVGTTKENALHAITETVSLCLKANFIIIGEIQQNMTTIKGLSIFRDGKRVDQYTYELKDSPCENVTTKGYCIYPDNVAVLFPNDKDLQLFNIRGYLGTPLKNTHGEVIGILCALFRHPISISPIYEEILSIVAVKAAAEIERKQVEKVLQKTQNLYENALEQGNLAYWEGYPLNHKFLFNDRFYALLGTTAELEGGYCMNYETFLKEFVHPDDFGKVNQHVKDIEENYYPGYTSELKYKIIRKDGNVRTVLTRYYSTKDVDEKITLYGFSRDITDCL